MRRISNQVRQRRRQTWLDIPAHGIEEAGHGHDRAGAQTEGGKCNNMTEAHRLELMLAQRFNTYPLYNTDASLERSMQYNGRTCPFGRIMPPTV